MPSCYYCRQPVDPLPLDHPAVIAFAWLYGLSRAEAAWQYDAHFGSPALYSYCSGRRPLH